MAITKASVKAKVEMLINLVEVVTELGDSLYNDVRSLTGSDDLDYVFQILQDIEEQRLENPDEIVELLSLPQDTEEGEKIDITTISLVGKRWYKLEQKVPGGSLVADIWTADYNTQAASLCYQPEESRGEISLAVAEVKQGELAELDGKSADNKDIDLYVYGDTRSEDWTDKVVLSHDEIVASVAAT